MTDQTLAAEPQNVAQENLDLALANDPHTATPLAASEAYLELTQMYSHRGDGMPTQFTHGLKVAEAARVMWTALITALRTPAPQEREGLADRERAVIIVELLAMRPGGLTDENKRLIRRARRAIDGLPEAVAIGEANYRAYCLASPSHHPEGTLDALLQCARMLEEYGIKEMPANENGQIPFDRAMMESVVDEIRAFAALAPPVAGRDAVEKVPLDFIMAILHGDDEHRMWLLEAAACWNSGQPVRNPTEAPR